MLPHETISEDRLSALVDRFYAKVRRDPMIGPVFNDAVDDWPEHLEKLSRFWSSVMLTSGRYKGNPAAAHIKHAGRIKPEMFERWLALWRETTDEMFPPEEAAQLQAKADRIGESLQYAIRFRPGEMPLGITRRAPSPPRSYRPYRITPIFDEESLPDALRREHRTKAGTWGVIRVLAGELKLHRADSDAAEHLSRDRPGVVLPEQTHWVEPQGPVRMRIEFHDALPVV